jgi:circadian clock protein KaiB
MESEGRMVLRLFVAGDSPDSAIAIVNLTALFPDKGENGRGAEIEIVDVRVDPGRAARDGIMVTPTLVKVAPSPRCRILGNLSNREALMHLLEASG